MTTTDRLLRLSQAAAESGLSLYRLNAAIERGDLAAVNIGTGQRRHLRVSAADLATFRAQLAAKGATDVRR